MRKLHSPFSPLFTRAAPLARVNGKAKRDVKIGKRSEIDRANRANGSERERRRRRKNRSEEGGGNEVGGRRNSVQQIIRTKNSSLTTRKAAGFPK